MAISELLNSDAVKYCLSALAGCVFAYSGLWHSVNKNSLNAEHHEKKLSSQELLLQTVSNDVVEIKIMLAILTERQNSTKGVRQNANFQNVNSNTNNFVTSQ